MSRLRKILLAVFTVCLVVCASLGIAACGPKFIEGGEFNGDYVVTVRSRGGLNLNNVTVSLMKNGTPVTDANRSLNGRIEFHATPDVYDVVVDESSLPEGYYLAEGASFQTKADAPDVNVTLDSHLISTPAPAGTRYRLGDAMHDFSFTDGDSIEYNLAETLETKKAVMLNFWGTQCGPCRGEFPAINNAYDAFFNTIEIFALSSYMNDSQAQVTNFKNEYQYSFPMAVDEPEIYRLFNVAAYPTSVMIDRYGVVAYISSGTETSEAFWRALFARFSSDDYTQNSVIHGSSSEQHDWVSPEGNGFTMPDHAAVAEAIGSDISNSYPDATDELSWDWVTDLYEDDDEVRTVLKPSNISTDYTYANFYAEITLNAGEGVSFDYFTDTKADRNQLIFIIDNRLEQTFAEDSDGWQTYRGYIANRRITLTLAFCFIKNVGVEVDTPIYIDNLQSYNASADLDSDLPYSVSQNANFDGEHYDVTLNYDYDNNYYTYTYQYDGKTQTSILYADLLSITDWSDKHYGAKSFMPENSSVRRPASLYDLSFWNMNRAIGNINTLTYDSNGHIFRNYYVQQASSNGYIPVTENLKQMLIEFTRTANNIGLTNDDWYEDQWLELCYYFIHHGDVLEEHECSVDTNPVLGFSFDFAIEAQTGENHVNISTHLNILSDMNEAGGGIKFRYVPETTGVYLIETTHEPASDTNRIPADPSIRMFRESSNTTPERLVLSTVASQDNDLRYSMVNDALTPEERAALVPGQDIPMFRSSGDVFMYVTLTAGQTYYITATMGQVGETGEYDFTIKYEGESARVLRVATTGDGMWSIRNLTGPDGRPIPVTNPDGSPVLDENGNQVYRSEQIYLAISVRLDPMTHIYYSNSNNSTVYINFDKQNYYMASGHTLYEMIAGGRFNFTARGGQDYTDAMMTYYNRAMARDEEDELHGFVAADETLVNMLNALFTANSDTNDPYTTYSNGWLMFAGYYETYGTAN